jgi:hypothetical protein
MRPDYESNQVAPSTIPKMAQQDQLVWGNSLKCLTSILQPIKEKTMLLMLPSIEPQKYITMNEETRGINES